MKKLLIFIVFIIYGCSTDPILNENVERYNIFLVMREDKNVQELYLSKVYTITDTTIADVEAEARMIYKDNTFKFEKFRDDIFVSEFKPVAGELYTLKIIGECGDLEIETNMVGEFEIIYPQDGDSLTIDDTIKIVGSDDIFAYELIISVDSLPSYYTGFNIVEDREDTVFFHLHEYFLKFPVSDSAVLKVFAVDSTYLMHSFGDIFLEYDTLKQYYGLFSGIGTKQVKVKLR